MTRRYVIEVEPEVRLWLHNLCRSDYDRVEFYGVLLAEHAETLAEPYTRKLGGKVRELRFHLPQRQVRLTYWLASGRRIVLLTVFRKSGARERAEVERARRAQIVCEAEHGHAQDIYDRAKQEEE